VGGKTVGKMEAKASGVKQIKKLGYLSNFTEDFKVLQ